jgi:hypothetical protein
LLCQQPALNYGHVGDLQILANPGLGNSTVACPITGNMSWTIAVLFTQFPGVNVIRADCDIGHGREPLCCKSGVEFQHYYTEQSNRKHKYRRVMPVLLKYIGHFATTDGTAILMMIYMSTFLHCCLHWLTMSQSKESTLVTGFEVSDMILPP